MCDQFSLDYRLHEAGWAFGTVSYEGWAVHVTASYLSHPLDELAWCANSMCSGGELASVIFMDEPGEHHLTFMRRSSLDCRFSLRWFEDNVSTGCNSLTGSTLELEGTIPILVLAQQVHYVLNQILEQHGEEGYRTRWGNHDFPVSEFDRLTAHLQNGGITR